MNNSYVYLFSDQIRNEPIYVGKGTGVRWKKHLVRSDMHPFTHRLQLMKGNGVDPIVTFICVNVDSEFALLVEQELIAKLGRKDLGLGPLLNLTNGGEGTNGNRLSEETRKKISAKTCGRKLSADHKAKISARASKQSGPNRGITLSEETKAKMSIAKKGMVWPTLTCHCGKVGSSNAMKRWHFDNCKAT
jgi:hypothetical protein